MDCRYRVAVRLRYGTMLWAVEAPSLEELLTKELKWLAGPLCSILYAHSTGSRICFTLNGGQFSQNGFTAHVDSLRQVAREALRISVGVGPFRQRTIELKL